MTPSIKKICKITQQRYGKCLQKLALTTVWPVITVLMLYPKTDRQCKNGHASMDLGTAANHKKITCVTLLKQQRQKKKISCGFLILVHWHHFRLTRTRPRAVSTAGTILLQSTLTSKVPSCCSHCTTEICSGSVQEKLNSAMNTLLLKDQQKYCYRLVGSHVACLHNSQPAF